jgi:hypothetical protein
VTFASRIKLAKITSDSVILTAVDANWNCGNIFVFVDCMADLR